ncbi:hypothetical protein LMH87_007384 [Akanthomyces muscarius]|uniref:Fatty acid hydroxylase domain-containing protein n=1 Tax=Akanthomyces muscarius TaxID=2231603 RepID=A0A9W8QQQ5_AKAMU|nr:hypothetical protein LMH87_007384 [Akanthomyces muscarius]KAJ4165765.1 hypothetical protein LMH87_007384 [Akanthomyces muscarius]
MAAPLQPDPEDSMKSTWRTWDRKKWNQHHFILNFVKAHPYDLDKPVPVHAKTDKIPYLNQLSVQIWLVYHSMIPLVIHQMWLSFSTYQTMHWTVALSLYIVAFNLTFIHEVNAIRRLAHQYGFLDGDEHDRDGVPDVGVHRVTESAPRLTVARMVMVMYFSYDAAAAPLDVLTSARWWLWLAAEIGLYSMALDFWFYWYHRAMHDVPFLWKFHRKHHLTKHPNSMLSAYSDDVQELFDMAVIPLLGYLTLCVFGLKLGFFEWYICHQYVAFSEVWGHSGLRIHFTPPLPWYALLHLLEVEGVTEDHDLHHRYGYRKSNNYSKQSRLWDKVFGTARGRIESVEENVDYVNQAQMPFF